MTVQDAAHKLCGMLRDSEHHPFVVSVGWGMVVGVPTIFVYTSKLYQLNDLSQDGYYGYPVVMKIIGELVL